MKQSTIEKYVMLMSEFKKLRAEGMTEGDVAEELGKKYFLNSDTIIKIVNGRGPYRRGRYGAEER
jgi:hypothetical protein